MITDQMLAEAAAELNAVFLDSLPEAIPHTFSPQFERKMKRLIHKTNHPTGYRMAKRVASIILVLFLSFMTLLAVSPTARAAVLGWIREQYETFVEYYFPENSTAEHSNLEYEIGKLPDGYYQVASLFLDGLGTVIYANDAGNTIHFIYTKTPNSGNIFVKSEGTDAYVVTVSGRNADLYIADEEYGSNIIIWKDSTTDNIFCISSTIEDHILISMAESVIKK